MQNSLNQRSQLFCRVIPISGAILGRILGNRAADLAHTWLRSFLNPWADYPALQIVEVGMTTIGLLASWYLGRRGWRRGRNINVRILAVSFVTMAVLSATLLLAAYGVSACMVARPVVMDALPPIS